MAEPPPAWIVPGDEPDDSPPVPNSQPGVAPGVGALPASAAPGGPIPSGTPTAPLPSNGWDAPPQHGPPPGWGPPPGQPNPWNGPSTPVAAPGPPAEAGSNQWSGPPNQWTGAPPQWGGAPEQWGGAPGQWGPAPTPGQWSNRGNGIVPLRPLAIGEIFDGAIRAMRSNPRTMVGFSAAVIALLALLATAPQAYALSALLNSPFLDPAAAESADVSDLADLLGASSLSLLVNALQFVLASTISSGLLIVAVNEAVHGQKLTPSQLWTRARGRLFAVLGLSLVVVLALPLIMLVLVLPGVILVVLPSTAATVTGVILIVLGVLAGFGVFVVLYFGFWSVAAPALLLENLGVFAALARSYRLVRGSFWRVFGISLLTTVIAYVIRQLFTFPFSLIGQVVAGTQDSDGFVASLIQLLVANIGTMLAGAVVFPFTAGVAALLYLDLRMRREGLDVDLMRS
jgi:hypothetical protein